MTTDTGNPEPDTPHQVIGCMFFGGSKDMPPAPPGEDLYIAVAPGGYLAVGVTVDEDSLSPRLRLGPGAVIKALEGGGFTITAPAQPEADPR